MNKLEECRTMFEVFDRHQGDQPNLELSSTDSEHVFTDTRWALERLESARDRLNASKAQLGQFALCEWQRHTDFTELSSNIQKVINQRLRPVTPPILTRAWIKFYEIIQTFPVVNVCQVDEGSVRAFFMCEAPGGFINASNHYLRLNHPQLSFDWLANTLNPYYESVDHGASVLDDRFIQNLSTFAHWVWGESNRGDLLEDSYIDHLESIVRERYHLDSSDNVAVFDFVTGDGAFDCSDHLDRQEELVYRLIYREIAVGLHFLKSSGSLVVKFFTFFSAETISLLYYLAQCFTKVVACKPVASKHGNSEIYVVATGFDRDRYLELCHGPACVNLETIPPEKFIFNLNLLNASGFLDRVVEFSESQAEQQMDVIEYNLDLYDSGLNDHRKRAITRRKFWVAETWLRGCFLGSINRNEQLTGGDGFVSGHKKYVHVLMPLLQVWQTEGHDDVRFLQNLISVLPQLELTSNVNQPLEPCVSPSSPTLQTIIDHLRLLHGHAYDRVNNSKFCCNSLLKTFAIVSTQHRKFGLPETVDDDEHDVDRLRNHLVAIFADQEGEMSNSVPFRSKSKFVDLVEQILPRVAKLHCLDLFDLVPCFTANDTKACEELYQNVRDLLTSNRLEAGDSLAIRVKCLLSRLSLGLVYLISRMFEFFSVNCWRVPEDGFASLVIIFKNFQGCPKIEEFFQSMHLVWDETLLEVLPIQLLITDARFFARVHAANCYVLGWKLKTLVVQMMLQTSETTP